MLDAMESVKKAESEAEKIISEAKQLADNKKTNIVSHAEEVKNESIKKAKEQSEKEMEALVEKCKTLDENADREIANEAEELKITSSKKMDEAIDSIISVVKGNN